MLYLQAVDLFLKNDLYDDLCLALGSLGSLRLKNKNCDGALKDINRGLEVAKRLSSEEKHAKTCDLLSAKAEVSFITPTYYLFLSSLKAVVFFVANYKVPTSCCEA